MLYIGVLIVLSSLQTQIIFPGAATQGLPDCVVTADAPGTELVRLKTRDGQTVVGLFGTGLADDRPIARPAAAPTILFFYGNGMCMADAIVEFDNLRRLGANVMIVDYVGYGMSSGRPSEQGCYATADAAWDHLVARADVDPKRITVMGWSLGAATAIDLASRQPAAALVACSAFTSVSDMARRAFSLPLLPTGWLVQHHFENLPKIGQVRCPILLAHGRRDSIIPVDMSFSLAAAAGDRLVAHEVYDRADHNDFFEVGGDRLYASIGRLLSTLPR
jgi:hypothetical protein